MRGLKDSLESFRARMRGLKDSLESFRPRMREVQEAQIKTSANNAKRTHNHNKIAKSTNKCKQGTKSHKRCLGFGIFGFLMFSQGFR